MIFDLNEFKERTIKECCLFARDGARCGSTAYCVDCELPCYIDDVAGLTYREVTAAVKAAAEDIFRQLCGHGTGWVKRYIFEKYGVGTRK